MMSRWKPGARNLVLHGLLAARSAASDGEAHVEDVALADDVVLALDAQLAVVLRLFHRADGDELVVADDLGPDEAALEVRVDHAGGLGCLRAVADLPRAGLVLAGREERDEVERPVARADHRLQPGLGHAELLEE